MTAEEFVIAYKKDKEAVVRDFDNNYTRIYLYINNLSVEEFMQIPAMIVNEIRANSLKEMQVQRESALLKAEMQKKQNEELMAKRKDFKL